MTRVRTHHEFVQRPAWDRLGADAFLLHHAALAYVCAHSTDGLVPKVKAKTLHSAVTAPSRRITALLAEGMWSDHDRENYRVCDVQDDLRVGGGRGDEQPSASFIGQEQERARVRKEAWRNKGRNGVGNSVPNGVGSRTRDSAVQDRAVQDSKESSPAPKPVLVRDEDCEHGIDKHSSCSRCALKVVGE